MDEAGAAHAARSTDTREAAHALFEDGAAQRLGREDDSGLIRPLEGNK